MNFPVDLQTFKLYFLREAGLEYQAYPNWDPEQTYSKDDKVTAIVNYNVGVYTSLVDDNNNNPSSADYWELDEDETENASDEKESLSEGIFSRLFP